MGNIKIAIFGHGNIGGGVSRILLDDTHSLSRKTGKNITLSAICTPKPQEDAQIYKSHPELFRDADDILSDPEISIICETIGGDTVALDLVKKALQQKKHVVTANKKMIARHFTQLHNLAKKNGVFLLYEAAVGGGIPMLQVAQSGLAGDSITEVEGILNGTTNFILTKMEETNAEFNDVLVQAQELGYAEADPTDDVEGFDAAYKLSILVALTLGVHISPKKIPTQGITSLRQADFKYAKTLGKKIKLVASAKKIDNQVFARVCPVLFPIESRIAKTDGVINAVNFIGKYNTVGNFLSGEGAGRFPTAAAIISDIVLIARGGVPLSPETKEIKNILPASQSWYLRFSVYDRPGIVGEIATIFGKYNISIDAVHQIDHQESPAHFMVTTFPVSQEIFKKALKEISLLGCNTEAPFVMPLREEGSFLDL